MHDRFQSRGVVFIGLTSEGRESLGKVRQFLSKHRIKWVNGYGADKTVGQFKVSGIPAMWVIGRDGKVVWNRASRGSMEDAIEDALAAESPKKSE